MAQVSSVLIVEDDQFLGLAYTQSFSTSGFTVRLVTDGKSALQAIEENRPDLIILDLVMPTMNGMEVLRSIRKDSKNADIKVIVATNVSSTQDEEECKTLGVHAYLIKTNNSIHDIVNISKEALGTQ